MTSTHTPLRTLPVTILTAPTVILAAPSEPFDVAAARSELSRVRARTSAKLRSAELPACFVQATVSAAVNAFERNTKSAKASRRRLSDKATKLAGVEVTL